MRFRVSSEQSASRGIQAFSRNELHRREAFFVQEHAMEGSVARPRGPRDVWHGQMISKVGINVRFRAIEELLSVLDSADRAVLHGKEGLR